MCGIFTLLNNNHEYTEYKEGTTYDAPKTTITSTHSLDRIKEEFGKGAGRGPEDSKFVENKEYNFFMGFHRLAINGLNTNSNQPIVYKDIVLICNGEIYNYKDFGDYKSDGYCLLPLYNQYGEDFVKKLDGEFAIIIFDFNKNKIILSSDIFSTKPLWYSIDNNDNSILISSLPSTFTFLNIDNKIKSNPNECISLDMNILKIIIKTNYYFIL